jgi:N-acetylmuramoyl-L-alanine amidase
VRWLVLHGTAGGSRGETVEWFTDPASKASTHYVVDRDGSVLQFVEEADTAWGHSEVEADADHWWADKDPNLWTISIEFVKENSDNSDDLAHRQRSAGFILIRDVCSRHGIPMRKADESGGITGHLSMQPATRSHCPGSFPWPDLWLFLRGGM